MAGKNNQPNQERLSPTEMLARDLFLQSHWSPVNSKYTAAHMAEICLDAADDFMGALESRRNPKPAEPAEPEPEAKTNEPAADAA